MPRRYTGGFLSTKEQATDANTANGIFTTQEAGALTTAGSFPTGRWTPQRSLRFKRANKNYLNRTPGTAGNRRTWTWSAWVKQTNLTNGAQPYFTASNDYANGTYSTTIYYNGSSFKVRSYEASTEVFALETTAQFRDPSAWYHFVIAVDTTHAIQTQRVKMYVNGIQQTAFDQATYPSTQNYDTYVNSTAPHRIGSYPYGAGFDDQYYQDGYMSEVNLIDGQALTPSAFGFTDPETGTWVPKRYAGTYGTNGFYLDFRDNTSTTNLALDRSGNSNNWTPNNISLTAGSTYDSMVDVPGIASVTSQPDVGGVQRGNYATLNPLALGSTGTSVLSGANLSFVNSSQHASTTSTIGVSSGKWYWEGTITSSSAGGWGFTSSTAPYSAYPDAVAGLWWIYDNTGSFNINNQATTTFSGSSKTTTGAVWQIALDMDTGKAWFGINNVWYDSAGGTTGSPLTGANPTWSPLPLGTTMHAFFECAGQAWAANFGQRAFAYTPPTGFKTLNTTNLPNPVIKRSSDHFDVKLYTGLGQEQNIGVIAKQSNAARIPGSAKFKASQAAYMTKTAVIPAASGGSLATVYNYTISSDTNNYSLYNTARASGYDGKSIATFNLTISASVVVGSVSNLFPALDLSGFPNGVAINVTIGAGAYVVGAGGAGGNGGGWPTAQSAMNAGAGGDAIWASSPVSITNNGTVAGGGGGGGGSEGWAPNGNYGIGGGGGGGGAGRIVGGGGSGTNTSVGGSPSGAGSAGTLTTGGAAGGGGTHSGYTAGAGGAGGNLGTAGSAGAGSPGNWNGSNYNPGSGGAAGYYVRGTSNVTWVTNGTRAGSTQALPQKYSGSGTTWTWSAWVKRTTTGATQRLFTCANASGDDTAVRFETDNIRFYNSTQVAGGSVFDIKSNATYADTNWHHVVAVCDTTNTSSAERVRLYVDGARIGSLATQAFPSENQISTMNWNIPQYLGIYPVTFTDEKFDGYMAEVNYVDGLALDATAFGGFDANNNWFPVTYRGTYGAAGYYLPFTGQSLGAQSYAANFGTNQYLTVASAANLEMGSSDFTVECFYYPTVVATATYPLIAKRATGSYQGFNLAAQNTGALLPAFYSTVDGSTWGVAMVSTLAVIPYAWNHVAITRSGTTWTMWVNGQKSVTTTLAGTMIATSSGVSIGATSATGEAPANGSSLISNVRIIKGTALYSVPFTPSTTALTAVANTQLLTCQNSTFIDNSANAYTIVNNGSMGIPQIAYPFSVNPTYSAYFATNRNLSVTGFTPNLSTIGNFTIEMWAYISSYATTPVTLFGNTTSNSVAYVYNTGSIGFGINGVNEFVSPAGVVQTSVWNHIAYVKNSTNLTIYVNGIAVATTSSASTYLANTTPTFLIGNQTSGGTSYPFNGYISNFRFVTSALYTSTFSVPAAPLTAISGTQLLTCADAGLRDLSTNNYVITNTNTVSASQQPVPPVSTGIGADGSGTTNHWAIANMNIAAGEAYQDWNNDVPSDYDDNGDIHGTYCILDKNNTGSYVTVANGGMSALGNSASNSAVVLGNMEVSTGKWYWEYTMETIGINYAGIGRSAYPAQNNAETYALGGSMYVTNGCMIRSSGGALYTGWGGFGSQAAASFSTPAFTKGDVIGVALDLDNGALYFHKNGSWMNSGSPTSGLSKTGALHAWGSGEIGSVKPLAGGYTPSVTHVNFGQQKFKYVPPTGFKSINTKNLADIGASNLPDTYGNFVNTPDLVWIKSRSGAYYHSVFDTVRGPNRTLNTNATSAQDNVATDALVTFNPNGFLIGDNTTGSMASTNVSGATYVAWNWNRGRTPGFDIVNYSEVSGVNTIKHNLGVTPKVVLMKSTSIVENWVWWQEGFGSNQGIYPNTTGSISTSGANWISVGSSNIEITSGQFGSPGTKILYLWAEVPGFSKFGTYTGNGSTDGPFVHLGFKPRWIMIKSRSSVQDWKIIDTARNPTNPAISLIGANITSAEDTNAVYNFDILSNGFKVRNTYGYANTSSATYIYAAFAESPFKYGNAR
jgi:3D (Asp-Asp-Asp) domain-containing protein